MAKFDPVHGWIGIQGYETYDLRPAAFPAHVPITVREKVIDEHLKQTEMILHGDTRRTFDTRGVRFRQFIVARIRGRGSFTWTRESPTNHSRAVFLLAASGTMTASADGPHFHNLTDNVVVIAPSSGPVRFTVPHPADFVLFSFDTSIVPPFALDPNAIASLSSKSVRLRTVFSYLASLVDSCIGSEVDQSSALETMTRSAAITLVEAASAQNTKRDIVTAARQIFVAELDDPNLDASSLAERLDVSRRTLFRAFANAGSTLSDEIQRARVYRLVQALESDPTTPASTLAVLTGFGSSSKLSRAIAAIYGLSLQQLRATVRDANQPAAEDSPPGTTSP